MVAKTLRVVDTDFYVGKKPETVDIRLDAPNHEELYRNAMRWSYETHDNKELKQFAVDFFQQDHLLSLPEYQFSVIGRQCWLLLNGAELPPQQHEWFLQKFKTLMETDIQTDDEELFQYQEPTGKARDILIYQNVYVMLDNLIHTKTCTADAVRDIIAKTNGKSSILKQCLEHYTENLADARRERINDNISAFYIVISELNAALNNTKAGRKSKNGELIRIQKQVKNVQAKQADAVYNLVGVSPAELPGSVGAILFNTKTRRVSSVIAVENDVLSVSGTTIRGVDEQASVCKILRQPEKALAMLRNVDTIARLRLVVREYLSGKTHGVSGRMNKDTIILKVLKK